MTQGARGAGGPGGTDARHTAQRNADYGFSTAQHTTAAGASAWAPPPGGPADHASAEATTGSLPAVSGNGVAAPPVSAPPNGASHAPAGQTAGTQPSGKARATRNRGPRRARLQLRHINPWTVLKFSCVLSVALFFVWLIVVGVLFGILDGAGIIGKINDTVTTIQGGGAKAPVTAGVVFGGAAIIGVVNVVLFIALSTIGSLVYNLCADLVGGIEITLSER